MRIVSHSFSATEVLGFKLNLHLVKCLFTPDDLSFFFFLVISSISFYILFEYRPNICILNKCTNLFILGDKIGTKDSVDCHGHRTSILSKNL